MGGAAVGLDPRGCGRSYGKTQSIVDDISGRVGAVLRWHAAMMRCRGTGAGGIGDMVPVWVVAVRRGGLVCIGTQSTPSFAVPLTSMNRADRLQL